MNVFYLWDLSDTFLREICSYTCHIDAQFLHVFLGDGENSAYPRTPWHTHDKPQQCNLVHKIIFCHVCRNFITNFHFNVVIYYFMFYRILVFVCFFLFFLVLPYCDD